MNAPVSRRNAVWRFLILAVIAWAVLLFSANAAAGTVGIRRNVNATRIYTATATLNANASYTIETTGLSAGADTVLYVWDRVANKPIASNDDCPGGGYRSCVQIPAVSTTRYAQIMVRAYDQSKSGTGTLRIAPNPGTEVTDDISFTAGYSVLLPPFSAGTHFYTVEEAGGTHDTVLLVEQSPASPLAMDDDCGIGLMSFVHLNSACAGTKCRVYVGSYHPNPAPYTTTTLIWDEDVHKQDQDGDGLSNALEAVLGTSPQMKDTDGDGIHDGAEVAGMAQNLSTDEFLTRFPMMGADPLKRDLWLQADWVNGSTNQYQHRMPDETAAQLVAMFAPEIRLHIDTGKQNLDPATRSKWGAWGGARRFDEVTMCGKMGVRDGLFHNVQLKADGGKGYQPGACSIAQYNSAPVIAHELGHNLNLMHGSKQSGDLVMNCAPNYPSLMSYCYRFKKGEEQFSRNSYFYLPLDPRAMDEQKGMGLTSSHALWVLQTDSYKFKVNTSTGAVDWNRNGVFDTGTVRAAPAWANGADIGWLGSRGARGNDDGGVALAWLSEDGLIPAGSSPKGKLYWFTLNYRVTGYKLVYRVATTAGFTAATGVTPVAWTPKANSTLGKPDDQNPATLVPNTRTVWYGPAAVAYSPSLFTKGLFVLYVSGTNLYAQSIGNSFDWTDPVAIGPGHDDPAAVNHNGQVYVFVRHPSGLQPLTAYTYSSSSGWSSGQPQASGAPPYGMVIKPSEGIGITSGYVRTNSGYEKRMVAIVPGTGGIIDFFVHNPGSGYWDLQSGMWPKNATTIARPSIAYVPFSSSNQNDGRYYMAWRDKATRRVFITQTEGNDMRSVATSKRLIVDADHGVVVQIWNVWHTGFGPVSLLYQPGFDTNLRAAWRYVDASDNSIRYSLFSKVTDQIYDGVLNGQNDFTVMAYNLACSLQGGPCPK